MMTGVGIPALVTLASWAELPTHFHSVCEALGDISYPLYATHYPLIFIVDWFAKRMALSGTTEAGLILIVTIVAAAALIPVDAKVRSWLTSRWASRKLM